MNDTHAHTRTCAHARKHTHARMHACARAHAYAIPLKSGEGKQMNTVRNSTILLFELSRGTTLASSFSSACATSAGEANAMSG